MEGVEAEKLDEAIDHLHKEAGKVWLDTNSILFCHALEYQNKLSDFLTESKDAIEALYDCIWTVVVKVMEDTGKPTADGLGITHASGRYASHHPDTLGFPLIYTRAHWISHQRSMLPGLSSGQMFWISLTCHHHCKAIGRHWMYCVKRSLKTWVVHQRWPRRLN